MCLVHQSVAGLILLASSTLIFTTKAEANAYRCFDRQTGQQVAVADIDITTPRVSCLPSDGTTTPINRGSDSASETLSPSTVSIVDPLAARRAINLARGTAVSLNGGLSQYRPSTCMFASAMGNPCITRSDTQGIEFTIPGGPPSWEQNDEEPSVVTVVVISPNGRSVLESRNK